ncbi:MAG: L-aspartate oxidase [Phycisphaerales bacterium]
MPDAFDDRRYLIPFRTALLPQMFVDTLVIGSGVAGLRAAIEAAEDPNRNVIVLAKQSASVSNTAWAQGGIAGVMGSEDSVQSHAQDTHAAGGGLCDEQAVAILAQEGVQRICELIEGGMPIDLDETGDLSLGREGGHRHHRIVHSGGDRTGRALQKFLLNQLRRCRNTRIFEHCFALDLLTPSDNAGDAAGDLPVLGVMTWHAKYGLQIMWAGATIIASGGMGQVYRETTNAPIATGDGIAMAWRAGATLADMAFMQFHPTTLYVAGATRALVTEAIRGEGAHLVNRDGHRFMLDQHEMAELAPRDIVSSAIALELARSHEPCVFLDVRHIGGGSFAERFPGFAALLKSFDIDPDDDLIPVHPAAHYTIGGIATDMHGATSLPGLFACGEAASTGVHGANRLASNSLLEGLIFGARAGAAAVQHRREHSRLINLISDVRPSDRAELDLADVRSSLRSCMWRNVGIQRNGVRLADAVEMFDFWGRYCLDKIFDEPDGWEVQNLLTIGSLMAQSALWREESRGVHQRSDFPETRSAFEVHDLWKRGRNEPLTRPVNGTSSPPESVAS